MPSYRSPAMRATFRQFLHGFVQSDELPFRNVLTATQIEQTATAEKVSFGSGDGDVYSVPLTLWAFVAQVVSDQKSCVAAVARVLVLLSSLGRQPCGAGTGAYCKAGAKLPERFLQRLACDVGRQLEDETPPAWRWHGRRVLLVDGSTLSMPDTPANQEAYPQPRSQQPGVGFPLLRWVALMGLATGAVLASAFGAYRGKQTGETALFRTLLDSLRPGDVLAAVEEPGEPRRPALGTAEAGRSPAPQPAPDRLLPERGPAANLGATPQGHRPTRAGRLDSTGRGLLHPPARADGQHAVHVPLGHPGLLRLPDLHQPPGRHQPQDPNHEAPGLRLPRSRVLQAQDPGTS